MATDRAAEPAQSENIPVVPLRSHLMLGLLLLIYALNFVDRQIIGILAIPIKAELGLTDAQLGWLGGLAFALFYTALGVPIAWLADRFNRVWIMTVALTVWSGFTAFCGATGTYGGLILGRLGVGLGEAGGTAPAYSLIADLYPARHRALALAIYSLGVPIGSALGFVLGGILAAVVDWRFAFVAVGLFGVALAPVFRLVAREPRREGGAPVPGLAASSPDKDPSPVPVSGAVAKSQGFWADMGRVFTHLSRQKEFWWISLGASCGSLIGYGLLFWMPTYLKRSFGQDMVMLEPAKALLEVLVGAGLHIKDPVLAMVSVFMAAQMLIGGGVGIVLGGVLADQARAKAPGRGLLVPALAYGLTAPLYALSLMTPDLQVAFFLFLLPIGLSLVWMGPVLSAVTTLVAPQERATASAIFLFINNLIGLGGGTVFLGVMSDALKSSFGDQSLKIAIMIGLSFYILAGFLMFLASREMGRQRRETP